MRQPKISAFASLAFLLAACQNTTTPVRVVYAPESPAPTAPTAPAAPEVVVETPTRLLPAFDAGGPAPITPMVATETPTPAPVAPMVAAETPAPAAPEVMAEATTPAEPVVAVETPAPAEPVVVAEATAPAEPVVVAEAPAPSAPVEPPLPRGSIVLAVGKSAQVGTGTTLRFESLESDSRCQPGVQCAWAGEVTLFFILQGESSTAGFELSSSTKAKATANGREIALMAYGACPAGTPGECATVNVAPSR